MWVLGADLAHVFESGYLPAGGVALEPQRQRLRAGLHWQGEAAAIFYGLTYISPEFAGQPEGQLLGSLNVSLKF